jgi:hypothetical protein
MEAIERQACRQRRSVNNYVSTILATVVNKPQRQGREQNSVAQPKDTKEMAMS